LSKIIKDAVRNIKNEKIKTKYVVASLPEEKSFLQVIQLPKMKEEDLEKAVYFEAENYVPLPIDQVYLSSQVIPSAHDHLDHLDVLIAALPKTTVDPYINSLRGAGLKPLAMEIESMSISRDLVEERAVHKPLLLMDMGENRTSFTIFFDGSLRFTATCQISSKAFSEVIAQALKINFKEAEALKRRYGISGNKQHSASQR